jgi:AraC family transcriptional regulator
VLGIAFDRLSECLQEELAGRPVDFEMVPSLADPIVFRLLLLLKQEVALGCPTGRLYGESVANAIIYHTVSRYGTVKPILNSYHRGLSTPALRRVLGYVDEFLANNLAVADVASVAGLSPYHFAKLFRQSVGRPIHQYVLDLRIERARKLIEVGKVSLAAIGAQVGFPNPSQFSATFRRRVGVNPREYSRLRGRPSARTSLPPSPFL